MIAARVDPPAVELLGVTKDYGRVRAVSELTLQIPEGSLFGLVGPNGAILHANVEGTRALLEEPSVLAAIRAAWQDAPADWSHTPLPDGVSLVRAPAGLGMHPAAPSRA